MTKDLHVPAFCFCLLKVFLFYLFMDNPTFLLLLLEQGRALDCDQNVFWECASTNLTWSHLCECMVCTAPKHRKQSRGSAEACVCRAGAARAHCAFTRRVSTSAKVRAADGAQRRIWFETKVKDRFLNQRRWTCWYSCRENMQVLSATASLVLLFFLFSFWKACYLCCLPHVTLWRLSLFLILLLFDSSVFAKHSVMY